MRKQEKNAILEWAKGLSNEELEKEYYDLVYSSLGSEAEEMYERGYDMRDIKEREAYEKYLHEKVHILEMLCEERGIKLWEEEKSDDEAPKYFDKNGNEITEGCEIRYPSGRVEKVYRTEDGQLGIDATNPKWIETGRAVPCEYGIYPLSQADTKLIEVVLVRALNGELLRELAGDMRVCYEAVKPGMMRLELEGCFGPGPEFERKTLMLVPMDMETDDIELLSDLWLSEQEKELGLPIGQSCSSNSWWAGHKDDSKDDMLTDKYDWLVEKCYQSDKLVDGLIAGAVEAAKEANQGKTSVEQDFVKE